MYRILGIYRIYPCGSILIQSLSDRRKHFLTIVPSNIVCVFPLVCVDKAWEQPSPVYSRYLAVSWLQRTQKRRPIAPPYGQGMGCPLWAHNLNKVLVFTVSYCVQYLAIFDSDISRIYRKNTQKFWYVWVCRRKNCELLVISIIMTMWQQSNCYIHLVTFSWYINWRMGCSKALRAPNVQIGNACIRLWFLARFHINCCCLEI